MRELFDLNVSILGLLTRYTMTRSFHQVSEKVIDTKLAEKLSRYMDFAAASYGDFCFMITEIYCKLRAGHKLPKFFGI